MMRRGKHYVTRMTFLEFQLHDKRDVRKDFFVDVHRIYSHGCHIYCYFIILIFKPFRRIKKHFIILVNNCLVPGNTNVIGSRETHRQGDLIASMFKRIQSNYRKETRQL